MNHKVDVTKLTVGQMQTNCYILSNRELGVCCIIDPGDDAFFIGETIQRANIKPLVLLLTHGHFDHVLGAFELQLAFDLPCYSDVKDVSLIARACDSAKHFGYDINPCLPPKIDVLSQDNDLLKQFGLTYIETPGHTQGSVIYYNKSQNFAVIGDLVFSDGSYGRTDFSYSNKDQLLNSINLLRELPSDTILYPGHGSEMLVSQMGQYFEY
jgi:glyoxylase-like metal-dependent hydrolase (beta-lactamase superfamily II)